MTQDYWHAVARLADVTRKPRRIMFDGRPVVLFAATGGVAALFDRCPHRHVPLSKGRVQDGEIECPYHGWRFGGDGTCTAIPGLVGEKPNVRVAKFATAIADGVVFISNRTPPDAPYTHCMTGQPTVVRRVTSTTRSTVLDAAENILDATHTHYTHKGLLRGLSAKRQPVNVTVTGGPDWVETTYVGEKKQDGMVSKLLEGARTKTVGRFRAPGIAELEYWGPKGIVLATTFHLRQADKDTVEGVGWLVGPRHGVFDHVKALAFKPLFHIALEQDRRVLRSASENAQFAPQKAPAIGPLDFLRSDIAAIMAGKPPAAMTTPRSATIML